MNIDTPEKHGTRATNGPMPFAVEASKYCEKNLEGQDVNIQMSKKENPYDSYGRLLGHIWIKGELYQEQIVSEGLALVKYVIPPDTEIAENRLYKAQEAAREGKRGIWSLPEYVVNGDYNYNFLEKGE